MKNPERFIFGVGAIIFIAFTPIIAWFITTLNVTDAFWGKMAIRILTGVLTYFFAMFAISGLREPKPKVKKEGKLNVQYFLLAAGVLIIAIAWLTDVSEWMLAVTGFSWDFELGGIIYSNTSIPTRLITAAFTFLGAILIKKSIKRKNEVSTNPDPYSLYSKFVSAD